MMDRIGKLLIVVTLTGIGGKLLWTRFGSERPGEEPAEDHYLPNTDPIVNCFPQKVKMAPYPSRERKPVKKGRPVPRMQRVGDKLAKSVHPHIIGDIHRTPPRGHRTWQKWLMRNFHRTQITLTNTALEKKEVSLWGMNKGGDICGPDGPTANGSVLVVRDQVQVGGQPGAMAIDPAKGTLYVANQLSSNISIIRSGQVIGSVPLLPFSSPVFLAVNTHPQNGNHGKLYAAGSLSDTVTIIGPNHGITNNIIVGNRPMDIAYDPVTDKIYVANMHDGTVTVIDGTSEQVIGLLVAQADPIAIAVGPGGTIAVVNSGSNSVSFFGHDGSPLATVPDIGDTPLAIAYNPQNWTMYVTSSKTKELYPIQLEYQGDDGYAFHPLPPIALPNYPDKIIYDPNTDTMLVSDQHGQDLTAIAPDHTIARTHDLGFVPSSILATENGQLIASDPLGNTIAQMEHASEGCPVAVNPGYHETACEFAANPCIIKHVKWSFSGNGHFKALKHITESPTGQKTSVALSHGNHKSPQHFQGNITEMTALENTLIDGRTSWKFEIGPRQTITIIIYFRNRPAHRSIPKSTAL